MRNTVLAVLFIVIALPAVLSGGEAKEIRLTGKVAGVGGEAVAGASVRLFGMKTAKEAGTFALLGEAATDSEGKFSVSIPGKGIGSDETVTVAASKEGYALGWTTILVRFTRDARVRLAAPAKLAGTVVDEAGRAVAGAEVTAYLLRMGPDGPQQIAGVGDLDALRTKTDEKGSFAFLNIPADAKAAFAVSAPGKARTFTAGKGEARQRYQFAAGRTDIAITLSPGATIEGKVIEKGTGEAIPDVRVRATGRSDEVRGEALNSTSGADGAFRFEGLAAGEYSLLPAGPPGKASEWAAENVDISVEKGGTVSGVTIEVEMKVIFEVEVTDGATGKPAAQAYVFISREGRSGRSEAGRTDKNGVYRARVAPGDYRIHVDKDGYVADGLEKTYTVGAGETTRAVVTLSPPPKVTGTVVDDSGNPVAGAAVTVVGSGSYGAAKAGADGKFRMDYTPPRYGESRLSEDTSRNASYLVARHKERNLAAMVEIEDPSKPFEIRMKPGCAIAGRVVGSGGKPIAGARVSIMLKGETWSSSVENELPTDADGRYEVKALPGDMPYDISAGAKDYGSKTTMVDLDGMEGERSEVEDIVLAFAAASLSGIVVGPNGTPVHGAQIYVHGDEQPQGITTQTDKEGKFKASGLVEGEVFVSASRATSNMWGSVTAKAGDENVKIVLRLQWRDEEPAQPKEPEPLFGKPLPDLRALGADSTWTAAVDESKGKPVLVCFFDRSQRPSRNAVDALAGKKDALKEHGVAVFLIDASARSDEEKQADSAAAAKGESSFPRAYLDEKAEETKLAWGVKALPWLILADREHVVRAEGFPVDELDAKLAEVSGK